MALVWGQPLEYIESLPESTLTEFMALNAISPFTHDAEAYRQAMIATILYNNNVKKKKDAKSVTDLFPYLSQKTPDWLEDKRVLKARNLMTSIHCHTLDENIHAENHKHICSKILEEIELERAKDRPDQYVIDKLLDLIGE